MTQRRSWEELADALAEMARDLLHQDTVQETLDAISAHAVDLVEGCEAAGILELSRSRQVRTLSVTDNVVLASDRLQGEVGEGPCLDATRDRERIYCIADLLASEERWPRYVPKARELGIRSMIGLLLYTDEHSNLGALDLYSSQPGAFDEHAQRVGLMVASHAAVALAGVQEKNNLRRALDSSRSIGEATGIVMSRYRLTEEQAFERLVEFSQRNNTKIRDLAQEILRIGEIPER